MKKLLLTLVLIASCVLQANAQRFPITVVPQVNSPAPVNFYNYADGTTINSPLRVQLLLSDISISNLQIRLKVSFEGQGIAFESRDLVVGGNPLFIDGGAPLVLRNTELAPYFEFQNLQGINANVYGQTIPEGSYQFCFEVFDFTTGNRLSSKTCATTFIFKNEPPLLNLPLDGTNMEPQPVDNIVFQWTPRHINVSNVEYELSIVEIWDDGVDPQTAFLSSPPVFQTTTRANSFVYGPGQPLLLNNKRYAWQVQAKALQGAEEIGLFKNEGKSEIFWFSKTEPCATPLNVYAEPKGISKINVFWDEDPSVYTEYTIAYREADKSGAQWFTMRTNSGWATVWDLKPNTTYEYKVSGKCKYQYGEYSQPQRISTEAAQDETANYNCGIVPDEIAITNREPIDGILIGDRITAGDFVVTITEIDSESGGRLTGKGYVRVPYFEFARFGVTFNGILVNTDYQLAEGEIVTLYDPTFGEGATMTVDVNTNIGEGVTGDQGGTDNQEVDFVITAVEIDENGAIVITGENGEEAIIPGGRDITITDSEGTPWTVGEDGTITKGEKGEGGAATTDNTTGMDQNGASQISAKGVRIDFEESGYYYFDAAPSGIADKVKGEYKTITVSDGGEYTIPYKVVASIAGHEEDVVTAKATFSDNTITKDDIAFKTKDGVKVNATWSGDVATLKLQKKFDYAIEEVLATLKPKDSDGKYAIAGVFNMVHLASQEVKDINVSIVPINTTVSNTVIAGVNEIYNKAGVNFNIKIENPLNIGKSIWDIDGDNAIDVGDSSLLAQYTAEERAINQYYKDRGNYEKNRYYIFVLGNDIKPSDPDIQGFMPLKRQYGFAFNPSNVVKTIAHELGHGIFGLEHPWETYGFTGGSTNWLMDSKNNGTVLNHMDWKKIHAPGLKLYIFQNDEEGQYVSQLFETDELIEGSGNEFAADGLSLTQGIHPNGKIVKRIKTNGANTFGIVSISKNFKYLIAGISVYEKEGSGENLKITKKGFYKAYTKGDKFEGYKNKETGKYFSKVGGSFEYGSGNIVRVGISAENGCNYYSQDISWDSPSGLSISELQKRIEGQLKPNAGIVKYYYNAGSKPECSSVKLLADILKHDASSECQNQATVEAGYNSLLTTFTNASATQDELVKAINDACLSSLRKFVYNDVISVFKKLASSDSIPEDKEIAILRIMTVIKSNDYVTFFDELKEGENKIYLNLLQKMNDSSIYWFDGNNLSNFLDVILYMHNNSETKEVRVDLIKALIEIQSLNANASKIPDLLSESNVDKIFNSNIKEAEKEFYYNALQENNFKLFHDFHESLFKRRFEDSFWNKMYDTVITLIAEKGTTNDVIYLLENVKIRNVGFTGNGYWNKIFKSFLFTKFPSDKKKLYEYLSKDSFDNFLLFVKSIGEHPPHNKAEELIGRAVTGFSKLIDEEGKIIDKILLVRWVLDNPSALSGEGDSLGALLGNILNNISSPEDKEFVYQELSKDGHDLFIKCADALSGSSDFLFKFTSTYSKLISEAKSGKVQDRIDIIQHAIGEGDDWSWFWFSDTEDVISAMFNDMSSSQARDFIDYFKKDGYKLFFQIWDVLKNKNWWGSIDNDNKRFENFVTSLAKNFILSGQLAENQFPENLTEYRNERQNYLTAKIGDIKLVSGNYVPMTRASFFNGTGKKNDYKLVAGPEGKEIKVTVNITDTDDKSKKVVDESFAPFDYIFIELLEEVKVTPELTYKAGDILAIPAFYLAWMDGYIGSDQLATAIRVGVDGVVIVLSVIAAPGTGGASLAALGAEIVFATTDATIALYGDEMKKAFGENFVAGLETANILWGIANLPSAVANLPKGLAKLKTGAGKVLESGTEAFKTFVKNAKNLDGIEVTLDLKKFASAIQSLKKVDRVAYINKLSEHIAAIGIKYDNLVASGINPVDEIKNFYQGSMRTMSKFYLENAGSAFAKSIDLLPSGTLQQKIVNKLLHLQFDGKTFCKISPDGILSEVEIFSKVENYTQLAGEFTATISVNGKNYTEVVSVLKDYRGKPLFRAKFSAGNTHDGDLINYVFTKNGNFPPYASGVDNVSDVVLKPGDKVFIVEYDGQKVPGGFGSKDAITSIDELRNDLAVLVSWKNPADDLLVIREYEILQPIQVRSGPIGPQVDVDGTAYKGGAHQYEFMDNWYSTNSSNYLKVVKRTILNPTAASGTNALTFNKLTDDIVNLAGSDLNVLKNGIKFNTTDNFVDVVIHAIPNESGKFVIKTDITETIAEASALAEKLQDIDPSKTIRLLSCDDGTSALEISKSLGRDIVYSTGEVNIYADGAIQTDKWYVARPNNVIEDLNINSPNVSGNPVLRLGKGSSKIGKIINKLNELGGLENARNFLNRLDEVTDADLISRIEKLTDTQLQKLDELYASKNFQLPGNRPIVDGKKVTGDFTVKTRNDKYDVYFNKYGYSDFIDSKFGPGKEFALKTDDLTGGHEDFSTATKWLKNKFKNDPNIKIKSKSTNVELTINGQKNTYTWHHHEDGKTIMLVVSDAHNQVAHTGGASIITKYLKGLFESPF